MREEPPLLSDVLSELAALSTDDTDVTELVHVACDRARAVLDSDGAIVLLTLDGFGMQPAGSSGEVGDIDALLANEGVPCRQAMQTGSVVEFRLETSDAQFPGYTALAADAGIARVLSVPLRRADSVFGTLSLVRLAPRDYPAEEIEAARRVAGVLASAIVHERALQQARAVTAQLEHALQARVVVEQAKGMVAAELGVTIDDALELIRKFARARRIRLAVLAADIVSRDLPVMVLRSA